MDIEAARVWVTSSATARYLQSMDDDAEAARDVQTANLRRMSLYPSGIVSEYRALTTALGRAQGDFNAEINNITFGRARDGRAALATYRAYVVALMALEAENGRMSAFVDQDAAALAERLVASLNAFVGSRIARESREMQRDLERLERQLQRARRELRQAEAQRVINGVLGIVGLVLTCFEPPVAAARAIAAASFAVPMLLDAALGPSSPDALGTANSAVSGLTNLPGVAGRATSRFAGVGGILISLIADTSEVELGASNLREIARELQSRVRLFSVWTDRVTGAVGELTIAQRMWDVAITRARRTADAVRTSESEYRDLQRQIETLR